MGEAKNAWDNDPLKAGGEKKKKKWQIEHVNGYLTARHAHKETTSVTESLWLRNDD